MKIYGKRRGVGRRGFKRSQPRAVFNGTPHYQESALITLQEEVVDLLISANIVVFVVCCDFVLNKHRLLLLP